MIDTLRFLGMVCLFSVTIPIVVYISVKLGTYAFYRGRHLFEKELKDGKK